MSNDIPDPRPDLQDPAAKAEYFRYELNAFLDLALQVGQIAHEIEISMGVRKVADIPEISGPGYYKQILNHVNTTVAKIYPYFEVAFAIRRKSILKGLTDLSWTIQRGYNITYGTTGDTRFKMILIPVDVIFTLAKENLSSLEERIVDIKPELLDEETRYKLKHHILLLLHILRVFFVLSIGADRITLAVMIKGLEDELNMVIGERCIPVSANLGSSGGGGLAGGVGQAFGTITNLMRSIGINPPEGIRPPTENQLSNIISGVFNNPALQATVQNSMAGLQNSSSTTDVVANIMGNIIKGDVLQDITQATTSTVHQALNQAPGDAPPVGNLENTLKNFVDSVARSTGAQNPADLANMPVNPTPGITPISAATATSSAPPVPVVVAVPMAAPQIVSSTVPMYKVQAP